MSEPYPNYIIRQMRRLGYKVKEIEIEYTPLRNSCIPYDGKE